MHYNEPERRVTAVSHALDGQGPEADHIQLQHHRLTCG